MLLGLGVRLGGKSEMVLAFLGNVLVRLFVVWLVQCRRLGIAFDEENVNLCSAWKEGDRTV